MADAKKLTVEELTIGNEHGPHMTLSPYGWWLLKDKITPYASLTTTKGHAHLGLYDANHQERVSLFIEGGGTPNLYLQDANGVPRLICRVADDGHACIEIQDGARNSRLELSTDEDESEPIITLKNSLGKALLEITLDYEGKPTFTLRDAEGHGTPWLTAEKKEG
jgi:hypothetical protein